MSNRTTRQLIAAALLATACSEGAAPERLTFTRQAGDSQTAAAGTAVAVAPAVRVAGAGGNGVAGVTVAFAVASGGGAVTGATQTTNADGIAAAGAWTLGESVGPNTLTATVQNRDVDGSPLTFSAQAMAGPAATLEKQAGDNQNGTVATPLVTPPSVLVTDAFANPVAGVDVVFMVASGDGSVSGPNPTTGANGIATVGSWVLGGIAGQNTLTAQSPGLSGSPATFTATAAAGQAATMTVVEGDDQSAAPGVAVPVAPKVRARDAFGNNVDGVPVSFVVSAGGGSVTGAAQSTGADGTAAVGSWTLGPTPGTNQLTATANTPGIMGNPIVFDATATALFNVGRYVGTWTGTWINNTFASTGTNTLTIAAPTRRR
jgi:adhesin/invasin